MMNLKNSATKESLENKASKKKGLQIESYFPVWFKKLEDDQSARVRSEIADQAVRRRVRNQRPFTDEEALNKVLERISELEKKIDDTLDLFQSQRQHKFVQQQIVLFQYGCHLKNIPSQKCPLVGQMMEIRMVLPSHPHEEIIILAKVMKNEQEEKKGKGAKGAGLYSCSVSFMHMATDQEEAIVRYLVQRQREEIRLENNI